MAKRVFVCSPLRGPDGQPSESNIKLARALMRAVFTAGHAPFVPHLLYPQVLTETSQDLQLAFAANFAFLAVCDEMWVYAEDLDSCSTGMLEEILYVLERHPEPDRAPAVLFMPDEFRKAGFDFDMDRLLKTETVGTCGECHLFNGLNSQGICLKCFAAGTPAP